jgi:hypothetical protein
MTGERDVRLADGRVLRVLEAGTAAGKPAVVHFHSTPQSRLVHQPWLDQLTAPGMACCHGTGQATEVRPLCLAGASPNRARGALPLHHQITRRSLTTGMTARLP